AFFMCLKFPFELRALREDTCFPESPQRDQPFPGHGDNPDLSQTCAAVPKPGLLPLCEGTRRLQTLPSPANFDGQRAHMAMPRFRQALFASSLTPLIGGRGQTHEGPNVLRRLKHSPRKKLHDIEPGVMDANSPQAQE